MRMKWTQELDDKLVELLKIYTNREAAEKLGCSYQAVRSRVKLLYTGGRRFRGLTRTAMQDEIEHLRAEIERLMREREQIFNDCAKRNAEHEAAERRVEQVREALQKLISSLDKAPRRLRAGVGGMTIAANLAATEIYNVPAIVVEEARAALAETEKDDD